MSEVSFGECKFVNQFQINASLFHLRLSGMEQLTPSDEPIFRTGFVLLKGDVKGLIDALTTTLEQMNKMAPNA
jgi:hypothetical protein